MGCDIHLVLEKRHNDKWVGVDTFKDHQIRHKGGYGSPIARSRNYERFAKLAGVRGAGPEPRGIPEDASDTTKYMVEDWESDGHSHSWLPAKEAAQIYLETEASPRDFAKDYPEEEFFGIEDDGEYRIIFWFDN